MRMPEDVSVANLSSMCQLVARLTAPSVRDGGPTVRDGGQRVVASCYSVAARSSAIQFVIRFT
jgi:hypothetical protein